MIARLVRPRYASDYRAKKCLQHSTEEYGE